MIELGNAMMNRTTARNMLKGKTRGQSFLELAIFLPILIMLITSLAEFGFLLNDYMNVIDGPREMARAISYEDASYYMDDTDLENLIATKGVDSIYPVSINPIKDNYIISIYSSACSGASCSVNKIYEYNLGQKLGYATAQTTRFTIAEVQSRINSVANVKPSSGVVVVELFYAYEQKLALPWIQMFGVVGMLPDPIPIYSYSVMPLPAAEP